MVFNSEREAFKTHKLLNTERMKAERIEIDNLKAEL
jgi:hypothetical protein